MDGFLIRLLVMVGLAAVAGGAVAERPAGDPTRPPVSVAPGQEASAEDGNPSAPVLQSVLIPGKGRPLAIIGGQQVRLGEKVGDSRLVRLTEREAVLEGPGGTEHLPLSPQVEKIERKRPNDNRTYSGAALQHGRVQ